jgi:3-phosphoshikimate 1-carboxyvinyltransferase
MLSALAQGESRIVGLSTGLDVASTSHIMVQLGASREDRDGLVVMTGPDHGLRATSEALDCGNSGTTMRLLAGVVSGIVGAHTLIGDESLSQRPMDRVARPLSDMGSTIEGHGERTTAPLSIHGSSELLGINYHVPMASAQVKSAILFAGLRATGPTTVREDVRTRSTTEDMMVKAGVKVVSHFDEADLGRTVTIAPGRPRSVDWSVPGDPSQAAFFAVLASIHSDATIEVTHLEGSPERNGYLAVLARMGAQLDVHHDGDTLRFTARSSALVATDVHAHELPSVDEVPVLVVAAAAATGTTAFRDVGELRHKESNRFTGSMDLATKVGCRVWAEGDDFFVEGVGSASRFSDFTMSASLDHRMVMAAAVAGLAGSGCSIESVATVATSYPQFFHDVERLSE